MKSILLSAVLITMALHYATADHVHSVLNLRLYNNQPFAVAVDGRNQGPVSNSFEIRNLPAGKHQLKIFSIVNNSYNWGSHQELIYKGPVDIYEGYEVSAMLDRFHGLIVEDVVALYAQPNLNLLPEHHAATSVSITSLLRPVDGQNNGGHHNGHGYGHHEVHEHVIPCMHPDDFNVLLGVIGSKWFESTKKEIAMQALSSHYFTSAQIAQLLGVFSFESTKLEVARLAYGRVIDPERFYMVYDSFTFESSIRDLTAYVSHH